MESIMNTNQGNNRSQRLAVVMARAFIVAGFFICALTSQAQLDPGGGKYWGPTNEPLGSWSFDDQTNWTDDVGHFPIGFTNLAASYLGNGRSLVVDSNAPAFLQYNVFESDNTTNLTVSEGSITMWFAPNWNSAGNTNGGTGPGEYGRLFEVGSYTDDSSYGWLSIFVDSGGTNLYFAAQTNDLSSGMTVYLSAPIDWTTNFFHFICVTYSETNSALYLDGEFITNGPGMTVYPGQDVLTNGLFIGSSPGGTNEAHGLFNTVQTYNYPLSSDDIETIFDWYYTWYMLMPQNMAMFISSAPTSQTSYTPFANVITGAGFLQANGPVTDHTYSTNFWITNTTFVATSNGTTTISFTIEGGQDGLMYDVFAIGTLPSPTLSSGNWSWLGQGGHFTNYTVSITSGNAFLMLGSPQDTDFDGLTDAYENLVSHSSPTNYTTDGSGMADGWEVLYFGHTGISPNGDPDGDQLSNYQEFQMYAQSYNPTKWNSSTNSVVGDGFLDFSGDGLANLMEASFGGNMMTNNLTWKANTSGDGLPDEYKTMVGLSPGSAQPAPTLPAYSKNPIQ
jgi:hypothetical protein